MFDFLNERDFHSGLVYLLIIECFNILNMSMKNAITSPNPKYNIEYYENKRKNFL